MVDLSSINVHRDIASVNYKLFALTHTLYKSILNVYFLNNKLKGVLFTEFEFRFKYVHLSILTSVTYNVRISMSLLFIEDYYFEIKVLAFKM